MRRNQRRKTIAVLLAMALLLCGLTGCEGTGSTQTERLWKTASEENSFENYIMGNGSKIDTEALKEELESAESTLKQQFKATAILCAMEFLQSGGGDWKKGMFYTSYPKTSGYALEFLNQVNTSEEEFWASLEDAFYPYDCFLPIFAAAGGLDGDTLVKLWKDVPADSRYADKWTEAVEAWIKANPCRLGEFGEALLAGGYYDGWTLSDWRETYLYNSSQPYAVRTATVDEALGYLSGVQNIVLAGQEKTYGADHFKEESAILGELCYATNLTVTIDEDLQLESGGKGQEEPVETEGRKVAVFYRNPRADRFAGSPPGLRLLGDFMLQLPESERPASAAEADYYLVLTAYYEYGDFYQTRGGGESKIQEVCSSTSVDLYDAQKGTLIRHLGTMLEMAPDSVVASYGEESLRYPDTPSSDALLYMYRHVNEPEAYRALVSQTSGRTKISPDEPVVIGSWELTYHNSEIVSEFDAGFSHFEADNGNQYVRSQFTLTNVGFEEEEFLSRIGAYVGGREVYVQLQDQKEEIVYEPKDMIMNPKCLNSSYLEPGETKEGELVFVIPESAAERLEDLRLVIYLGNQAVYYPIE